MKFAFGIVLLLASLPGSAQINSVLLGNTAASGTVALCTPVVSGGTVAMPGASPAPGPYASAQSVALSCSTSGAVIGVTTDGSTPTAAGGVITHGAVYSAPIPVTSNTTIKAIGALAGWTNSALFSGAYTITPPTGPVFSPAAGTYTSAQSVSITCPAGKDAWYRTDGQDPTIASTHYTGPVTVGSSQTIKAICATFGAYQTNTEASTSTAKCNDAPAGSTTYPSGLTCIHSGGVVGTPTDVGWTVASPATIFVTAPASSGGETQVLFSHLYGGGGLPAGPCDSCTVEVQDITYKVTGGVSGLAHLELDIPQYDPTHGNTDRQNGMHFDLTTGFWYVDSGNAGGWKKTSVSGTLTQGTTYELVDHVTHDLTGPCPGGLGCAYYDFMVLNGVKSTLGGSYGNTQGYSSATGSAYGHQVQTEQLATGGSPSTVTVQVLAGTVALGFGDETAVNSAAYVIATQLAAPTATPAAGTYSSAQSVVLNGPSGANLCFTTNGSTPTAPTPGSCGTGSTLYTGPISVPTTTTIQAISTEAGFINSTVFSGTWTISGGSGAVATPAFSIGSGSVSPGTAVTASTATSGATVYYTMTTDGTTPPDPTYDTTTYMPAANSTTFVYGTAGTSGITAGNSFVSGFNVYGPVNVKLLAAKVGMTDSAIATASYTTTAPSGTAITSCGMLPATAGTYYLTGDLSCPGNGIQFGGINQIINLNGHTLSYGTANATVLSGTDLTTSASSTTVSCSSCTFTAGMVNDILLTDNYNQGGFANNGSTAQNAPLITAFTDSHHVVLNGAPGFTQVGAEYGVYTLPVYGVLCNKNGGGGADCNGGEVINGTITQGATSGPYSWAIAMQPASFDFPGHGNSIFANLTFNISGIEAEAVEDLDGLGGDQVLNNVINDTVTQIYYRDGLPYPINLNGNQPGVKSPIDQVHDNKILGSPQGGVYMDWTTTMLNNYINMNGADQYANGFGAFLAANNSIVQGNSINGFTQGIEEQASNTTMQNNYVSIVMHNPVQDPNHNLPQCELGYGFREKDFGGGGNPLGTGTAALGTPLVTNALIANVFNDDSGSCGVNDVEFSLVYSNDTTSVTNNILSLNMSTSSTVNPSEIYGIDETNAAGITYSGNTHTISGAFAVDGYAAYVNFDQTLNWTVPLTGLTNPALAWRQGASGINTTATFTGTGTPTCTKISNSGSTSTWTATFNGATVNCPQ